MPKFFNMYTGLLHLHRTVAYLVLVILLVTIIKSIIGRLGNKPYQKIDNVLSLVSLIGVHSQFLIGIILYFVSPIIKVGLSDVGAAMKNADVRFFLVEHIITMIIGIILITIGRSKTKRVDQYLKFKTQSLWFLLGYIFILARVPWDKLF